VIKENNRVFGIASIPFMMKYFFLFVRILALDNLSGLAKFEVRKLCVSWRINEEFANIVRK